MRRSYLVACCATRYTGMVLRQTDLYVLTGALANQGEALSLRGLAEKLFVDHTVVSRALKRSEEAGLYQPATRRVNPGNFAELMIHAARFIAPAPLGGMTRGFNAAWAAAPISALIRRSGSEPPPVWPSALGVDRGQSLEPLHPGAVGASADPKLGNLLAIIDCLRSGDARVRNVAASALEDQLAHLLER
jgi:DNA-binding transcriptional MocR family regulator